MKLGGLLNKLVSSGALSEQAAVVAQAESTRDKKTVANYLVEKKLVAASKVASISAAEFGLPVVDLDAMDIESIPKELVDEKLVRKHTALPLFRRGNRLFIAIAEPTNLIEIGRAHV